MPFSLFGEQSRREAAAGWITWLTVLAVSALIPHPEDSRAIAFIVARKWIAYPLLLGLAVGISSLYWSIGLYLWPTSEEAPDDHAVTTGYPAAVAEASRLRVRYKEWPSLPATDLLLLMGNYDAHFDDEYWLAVDVWPQGRTQEDLVAFLDAMAVHQRVRSKLDWTHCEILLEASHVQFPIGPDRLNIMRTRCSVRAVDRAIKPNELSDASLAEVLRVRWEDSDTYRNAVMGWVERNPTAGQHLWLTLRETRWCQQIVDANHVAFLADLFLRQTPDHEGLRIVREFAHEEPRQSRLFEGFDNERMLQQAGLPQGLFPFNEDEDYYASVHRWVQERAPSEVYDLLRLIREHVEAGIPRNSNHYADLLLELHMCWGQPEEAEYDRLIAILDPAPQK